MEIINQKFKDQNGSSFIVFTMLLILIITISLIVMEYFRVIELYDEVITEMERASNIAVEYAMIDEARGYHISQIDEEEARNQFDTYFKTRLDLTSNFEKIIDGKLYFKVVFDQFKIDSELSNMNMDGTVYINLQLISNYITTPIGLPFKIHTDNINIEE